MGVQTLQNNTPTRSEISKQTSLLAKNMRTAREKTIDLAGKDYAKYELAGKDQTEINKIMNGGVRDGKSRLDRLADKSAMVYLENYRETSKITQESSKTGISNEYYYNLYIWAAFLGVSFKRLKPEVLDAAVYSDPERIRKKYPKANIAILTEEYFNQGGPSLIKTLGKNRVIQTDRVIDAVRAGIRQGRTFRQISSDIKRAFDINFNDAKRVVRTEGHRTLQSGKWTAWMEAVEQGANGVRQLVAVFDDRTREQSAEVDGLKEGKDGKFHKDGRSTFYPGGWGVAGWDINDRETAITVIEGVEPTQRTARNPVTGEVEVIGFGTSFNDWLKDNGLKRNKSGRIVNNL